MPSNDRREAKVKLLQFLQRLGIFGQIGKIEIAELLFENAIAVEDLFLWEINKDTIRRVRWTKVDRLYAPSL